MVEPHIKLLLLDMVNFVIGKLPEEDRRNLICDLYEMQMGMDGTLDQN